MDAIKSLKARIEFIYEKRGMRLGRAYDIFMLKNMGWKDTQSLDHTVSKPEPEKIDSIDQNQAAKNYADFIANT